MRHLERNTKSWYIYVKLRNGLGKHLPPSYTEKHLFYHHKWNKQQLTSLDMLGAFLAVSV